MCRIRDVFVIDIEAYYYYLFVQEHVRRYMYK